MRVPIRWILAAGLLATVLGGTAAAQTVVARKVPAGASVEVSVNGTAVGKATPDPAGDASVPFKLKEVAGAEEIDATVSVDVCGTVYRVVVVARNAAAPLPAAGCDRRTVGGMFLIRRVTTLVVQVGGPIPTVLLIQGSYDLTPGPKRTWRDAPTGLVLFGGAGRSSYSNVEDVACGNVGSCSAGGTWGALTGGADFWLTPYLAATGSFIKPAQHDISGTAETFEFDSYLDAWVLTFAGKFGIPIGPVRAYGQVGGAYHQATFATTQTDEPRTITVDGVEQVIPGGTQSFEINTEGVHWTFGGGAEAWLTGVFALYGEVNRTTLKGDAKTGEGAIDDTMTSFLMGVRIRIRP